MNFGIWVNHLIFFTSETVCMGKFRVMKFTCLGVHTQLLLKTPRVYIYNPMMLEITYSAFDWHMAEW